VLRQQLVLWIKTAEEAGLDEDSINALFTTTLQQTLKKEASK
jgi:hypothetical protein